MDEIDTSFADEGEEEKEDRKITPKKTKYPKSKSYQEFSVLNR
jgi:hypothetical protein